MIITMAPKVVTRDSIANLGTLLTSQRGHGHTSPNGQTKELKFTGNLLIAQLDEDTCTVRNRSPVNS